MHEAVGPPERTNKQTGPYVLDQNSRTHFRFPCLRELIGMHVVASVNVSLRCSRWVLSFKVKLQHAKERYGMKTHATYLFFLCNVWLRNWLDPIILFCRIYAHFAADAMLLYKYVFLDREKEGNEMTKNKICKEWSNELLLLIC